VSRPPTTPISQQELERRKDIALHLRQYFDEKLALAKAAKPGEMVIWPTVHHFCSLIRLNHDHLRAWQKSPSHPFVKAAVLHCKAVREEMVSMELLGAVYDSKAHLLEEVSA